MEAMITAGKPPKVAIVAIMRKLFILANALIRDQRKPPPPLDQHGHYNPRRVAGLVEVRSQISGSKPCSHRKGALPALDRDPFEFGHLLH